MKLDPTDSDIIPYWSKTQAICGGETFQHLQVQYTNQTIASDCFRYFANKA